jgi:hypothetical protein
VCGGGGCPSRRDCGKGGLLVVIALTGTTSREHLEGADLVVKSLRELIPEEFKELLSP